MTTCGGQPRVLASLPKSAWAEVALLPPATVSRIREVVGAPSMELLEKSIGVAWVPFELEARIADAVYQVLGGQKTRELYRNKTLRSFQIPIIRPIVDSALRLFGATPASLVRMMGRSWKLLSRDCGSYECESLDDQRRCESVVRCFPTSCYKSEEAWRHSSIGGYEGFFLPVRAQGKVSLSESNFNLGHARFVLEW